MQYGFMKVAAATPRICVADPWENMGEIRRLLCEAEEARAELAVFPELCLTGSTCGDLFAGETLARGAEQALAQLLLDTKHLGVIGVVGLPVRCGGGNVSACAVFQSGKLLGVVPRRLPPPQRSLIPAPAGVSSVSLCGQEVPLGDLCFADPRFPDATLTVALGGVEALRDAPPAKIVACLGAQPERVGRAARRRLLAASHSVQEACAVVCAEAGEGESTTDAVFAGHRLVMEAGKLLAEAPPFSHGLLCMDVDTDRLCVSTVEKFPVVPITWREPGAPLHRRIAPSPFLPASQEARDVRCEEILSLQTAGLKKRVEHLLPYGGGNAVLGLSGGLDSTLALLVAVRAFDALGLERSAITAVSMPCFGTTRRTQGNAQRLAQELGVTFREIPIKQAVEQHFRDIGQDPACHDVTFENAQARERTQVLMDLANRQNGIVIGTGDLSELALGWATYNGDHMSMYAVNSGVPKTLVRHLVEQLARQSEPPLAAVLRDIFDTPVSPELLPPVDGEIAQKTEDLVGPYDLHDFFLFYALRHRMPPEKLLFLAKQAFAGRWTGAELLHWLKTFYRRFFAQQFKRSCMPDGVQVGSVGVSPRGGWEMPSDACASLWLRDIGRLEE